VVVGVDEAWGDHAAGGVDDGIGGFGQAGQICGGADGHDHAVVERQGPI
jgi:hypothetical protein